jgi:hypothetical protein
MKDASNLSSSSSSFLGSTAQLRPWPPPQNPADFLRLNIYHHMCH